MSELILHHYWESPYAEKVRRILGFKQLAWKSVLIPMVMPKPDLMALTGGYRKTPVLQIGADIYCDSDLIARVIERVKPEPTLFPRGSFALSYMLGPWQQELFWISVRTAGASGAVFPPGFLEDRARMMELPITRERAIADIAPHREQLRAKLDFLDRHLREHRFVLGEAPSLADFEMFHPVNTLKVFPQSSARLDPFPAIREWMHRIEAFGYGDMGEMTSAEAVEVAHAARPLAPGSVDPDEPNGLLAGDRVEIVHESFGRDPMAGELVASTVHDVSIRRRDDRAGEVVVHFPREHYQLHKL